MVRYCADLLEACDISGRYRTMVATETMVMRLLSGIVSPIASTTIMIFADAHVKDHLLADFNGAVRYLLMKCTKLFPPKTEGGSAKVRVAAQARTGSSNSKGMQHHDIDGKKVPFFNGVNVSNINNIFSRADFTALGQEGRVYVNNRRPGGRYKGRSRSGGGGRGRGRGGYHSGNGCGGGGRDNRYVQQAHYHDGGGWRNNDHYGYGYKHNHGGQAECGHGGPLEIADGGGESNDRKRAGCTRKSWQQPR